MRLTPSATNLGLRMYEADPLLVDGYQEQLRVVGVRGLLHLEEGGAEGGPPVDHLKKGHLGIVHGHPRVLVVSLHNLLLPFLRTKNGNLY